MKSWSIGVFGLVALAAIVASTFVSREAMVGAGIAASAAVGIGWPHFLAVPAKKTLAAVIGLAGAGSAVTAATCRRPDSWTAHPRSWLWA